MSAPRRTRAEPGEDGSWRLFGDKWFCSNADADSRHGAGAARRTRRPARRGWRCSCCRARCRTGAPNAYRIVRLKDKLGTRVDGQRRDPARGRDRLSGRRAAGRGFRQMADMVNNSRLSNGVRAAGLMRRAVHGGAVHRPAAASRSASALIEMPLMRRQLDEDAGAGRSRPARMMFQTAEALRRADAGEPGAYSLLRILTPLIKFRACRDARKVTGDAMEVRGGCGYIEEWPRPAAACATRIWARSGRARATSSPWTCCAPLRAKARSRHCGTMLARWRRRRLTCQKHARRSGVPSRWLRRRGAGRHQPDTAGRHRRFITSHPQRRWLGRLSDWGIAAG